MSKVREEIEELHKCVAELQEELQYLARAYNSNVHPHKYTGRYK